MAEQKKFTQVKVNKEGVFFISDGGLGDNPTIVITSPDMKVNNPIKAVEKQKEGGYKVYANQAYAGNKVSGEAFSSVAAAAKGSTTITSLAPDFLKNLFSFKPKQQSKKKLFLKGIALTVLLVACFFGAEKLGIIEKGTVRDLAATGESLLTEKGRIKLFNNHSFFESQEAETFKVETGNSLDSLYAGCSPTLIVRKKPVKMGTVDQAENYCSDEVQARLPTLEELRAITGDKTIAAKLKKPPVEWTSTGASWSYDDNELFITPDNLSVINQLITKIGIAEDHYLDDLGKDLGDETGRGDLADKAYRKKLFNLVKSNNSIPQAAEISETGITLDEDEKVWFRCVRTVPADEALKVAQND
jgi:hypothetical protein